MCGVRRVGVWCVACGRVGVGVCMCVWARAGVHVCSCGCGCGCGCGFGCGFLLLFTVFAFLDSLVFLELWEIYMMEYVDDCAVSQDSIT